jgi:hypothetical protein
VPSPSETNWLTQEEYDDIVANLNALDQAKVAIDRYSPRLVEVLPVGVWVPVSGTRYRFQSDGKAITVALDPSAVDLESLVRP